MVWLITDTHLWHDNIVKFCNRPVDHTERIIGSWRRMVFPDDTVIHLGDIMFTKKGGQHMELSDLLATLPGQKHLVRGNHDRRDHSFYLKSGFLTSQDVLVRDQIHFSHRPAEVLERGCKLNIHGHVHNDRPEGSHYFPKSVAMAIEYEDYQPTQLTEFLSRSYVQEIL